MKRSMESSSLKIVICLACCLVAGLGLGVSRGACAPARVLTVYAASSLTQPFGDLCARFQASHPDVRVRASYAGTQELRMQVEQGARCDVFASASTTDMDALVKAHLVTGPVVFARNRLCLIVYPGQRKVTKLEDLAKPGVRLVVGTAKSPIGRYTRACWDRMAQSTKYGRAMVDRLKKNVVSEETNVKLVLTKVRLGEADAGFVYVSDAFAQKVRVINLPAQVQVRSTYVVGVAREAREAGLAREFNALLTSPVGSAVLRKYGIDPVHVGASAPARPGK